MTWESPKKPSKEMHLGLLFVNMNADERITGPEHFTTTADKESASSFMNLSPLHRKIIYSAVLEENILNSSSNN